MLALFRGEARIEHAFGSPPQINDRVLSHQFQEYMKELLPADQIQEATDLQYGGEDFAYVSERVPGVYFYLFGGSPTEGYPNGTHTITFSFDEDVLPIGTAIHAYVAFRYLED